ncbi:MAG: ABC transporter ATP-binding protein [Candidatus Thorarchaeota archaeon]
MSKAISKSEVTPIYAVELENISKTFAGGVKANKNISLKIQEGEVHGLLGENGAGKSTLMNILYGLISQDEGSISIRGEKVELSSPNDAIVRGVGMVHQHFKLIPPLTVTENVVLGMEPTKYAEGKKGRFWNLIKQILPINYKKAAEKIKKIGIENGLEIDPQEKIQDMSVGLQQRVEIIKTLYREADILILDEPTSVLTPQEVDELFVTLEKFKAAGKTIILITHKLREPMILCDRISVLRDGELVGTVKRADTSPEELAQMMVGREVVFRIEKEPSTPGDIVLQVDDLYALDNRKLQAVDGISAKVRAGEIYGIAGVEGNGQTELVEVIAGIREPEEIHQISRIVLKIIAGLLIAIDFVTLFALIFFSGLIGILIWCVSFLPVSILFFAFKDRIIPKKYKGRISVKGADVTGKSPQNIRESGISHIPEDRHARGLILSFTITENIALGTHQRKPFATGPKRTVINLRRVRKTTEELVNAYSIKVSNVDAQASTLSGGNQQKVVVARELSTNPALVIAAQPTRGLDVGATEFIHRMLLSMRDQGVAVLLVSAELDEIRMLSDRIGVIFDGKIVAEKDPDTTTAEELGLLMAGHTMESGNQ